MAAAMLRENPVKSRDRMSMRRVIIKQSYLRKLARVGASFKSPRRRWFVFGVMNGTDPYLEYYETEESTFTGSPINMFFLDSCKRVVKNKSNRQKNVFTIVLRDRDVTLVAETRVLMDEWCSALTRKLQTIGIFVDDDADHVYVMNPVSKPLTMEQRERFYPNRPSHQISCDRSQAAAAAQNDDSEQLILELQPDDKDSEVEQENYEATRSPTIAENSYTVPAAERAKINGVDMENGLDNTQNSTNGIFMPDTSVGADMLERRTPSPVGMETSSPLWPAACSTPTPASWVMFDENAPNNVNMPTTPTSPQYMPTTPTSPQYVNLPSLGPLSRDLSPPVVSDQEPTVTLMTPKVLEASGVSSPVSDAVVGWNMPPPDADAPPLYTPQAALERGANMSLKHSQIDQLQQERDNPGGVKIMLKRKDCLYAVAFVDCFRSVWIAGWNQKARPHLHNAFHIGDKIISINSQVVESAKMAMKLLKQCPEDSKITFILKRIPNAKLLAMRRNYEAEDLGMRRNDGTAEIHGVDELGPAGHAGLTLRAVAQSGDDLTNWWLTEINHRPLNLFFKDDEIEKRLNAVGLDISAVVQPTDFITELKRKLKAFRNYKDFLLQ